jgi:hypothetical protein
LYFIFYILFNIQQTQSNTHIALHAAAINGEFEKNAHASRLRAKNNDENEGRTTMQCG